MSVCPSGTSSIRVTQSSSFSLRFLSGLVQGSLLGLNQVSLGLSQVCLQLSLKYLVQQTLPVLGYIVEIINLYYYYHYLVLFN